MMKGEVGVIEPRQEALVETAHPLQHFATDGKGMRFGLHPLDRHHLFGNVIPRTSKMGLVLA